MSIVVRLDVSFLLRGCLFEVSLESSCNCLLEVDCVITVIGSMLDSNNFPIVCLNKTKPARQLICQNPLVISIKYDRIAIDILDMQVW